MRHSATGAARSERGGEKVARNTAQLGAGEDRRFRWKREEEKDKARKQRPL